MMRFCLIVCVLVTAPIWMLGLGISVGYQWFEHHCLVEAIKADSDD